MYPKQNTNPIPFYLVTGFLGSGKTTLLKRFLSEYSDKKRIGIIQNEFAPGAVDGKELQRTGHSFELLEINKGSVFCVCLLSDFRRSLADFISTVQPDIIILEATGLADPIAIGEFLEANELRGRTYLAQVWCVVDSVNFLKMEQSMTRMRHQVRIADVIILNKSDMNGIDNESLKRKIKMLNPFASIQESSFCDVPIVNLIATNPVADKIDTDKSNIEPGGRPELGAKVIRTTRQAKEIKFADIIGRLAKQLYRIKGYIRLDNGNVIAVQASFGDLELKKIENYEGPSELILMGPDLETHAELYRSIFK